ncbi:MAG: hypothetical protein ACLGIK_15590, partial [Gemmatimonadota bacterium]
APVAPEIVDSRVPPELSAIVMMCLAKAAGDRYQTGNELADALLEYLMTSGSSDEQRAAWFARRSGSAAVASL